MAKKAKVSSGLTYKEKNFQTQSINFEFTIDFGNFIATGQEWLVKFFHSADRAQMSIEEFSVIEEICKEL